MVRHVKRTPISAGSIQLRMKVSPGGAEVNRRNTFIAATSTAGCGGVGSALWRLDVLWGYMGFIVLGEGLDSDLLSGDFHRHI